MNGGRTLQTEIGQRASAREKEFRRSLLPVPAAETQPNLVKTTLRFSFLTVALCVAVIVILFFVYFLPFSQTASAGM